MTNNVGVNDPNDFDNLSDEQKEILVKWIPHNLGRADRVYKKASSYYLKELFEKSPQGFYISNGQFKGAMLAAEYRVFDKKALNWHFGISKLFLERLEKRLERS